MHDVFLLGQRFGELDLVVVEQGFVRDDDERDAGAEGVEDGAGACSFARVSAVGIGMLLMHACFERWKESERERERVYPHRHVK